jgi:small-conductance mechanosensitive channel
LLDQLPGKEQITLWLQSLWGWLDTNVLEWTTLVQAGVLGVLVWLGIWLGDKLSAAIDNAEPEFSLFKYFQETLRPLHRPMVIWVMIMTGYSVGEAYELPVGLLDIATSLLTAWIVIRFVSRFFPNRQLGRAVAVLAWTVAALDIINMLDPIIAALDTASLELGDTRITAFGVIGGIATFFIAISVALLITRLLEGQLKAVSAINPSIRVLITKTVKIVLVSIALLVGLNTTGVDLTAFAVFGGALGVGLGFGLQKVVSNFISGIILLMDQSIKPGDVIEIEGTYGQINNLAARYTSVITRDGTEYLIPNEDMITRPVTNWSHSHNKVRRRIPLTISYDCDPRLAMKIMEEVAREHPRCLKSPAPVTRLIQFGDNGVDLELRLWINDPQNGVRNVSSDVMLSIWDRFKEVGIEFPYPQRVLHIKNGDDAKKLS